jgi:hypothetical protein
MTGTFKDFLAEGDSNLDKIADIIVRDCKKWLIDSNCIPIYRGMGKRWWGKGEGTDLLENILKIRVMKDREPRDSPKWLHESMSKKMVADFGIPFRSQSVFAIRSIDMASNFGEIYMVYPIGRYDYAWSAVVNDATVSLYEWSDNTFISRNTKWDDLANVVENMPTELADMFQRTWDFMIKEHEHLKNRGFDSSLQSFMRAMQLNHDLKKEIIELVIFQNDLWTYNNGLMQVLTKPDFNETEIMIATDSYYAVKFEKHQEHELIHKLIEKLKHADGST